MSRNCPRCETQLKRTAYWSTDDKHETRTGFQCPLCGWEGTMVQQSTGWGIAISWDRGEGGRGYINGYNTARPVPLRELPDPEKR